MKALSLLTVESQLAILTENQFCGSMSGPRTLLAASLPLSKYFPCTTIYYLGEEREFRTTQLECYSPPDPSSS